MAEQSRGDFFIVEYGRPEQTEDLFSVEYGRAEQKISLLLKMTNRTEQISILLIMAKQNGADFFIVEYDRK